MSWADDFVQRDAGAKKAAGPVAETGYLGGFISSVSSGFGELFGQDPTPEAQQFRMDNPFSGFASQMVSPMGVYGAAYKLSKVPKAAAMLEGTLGRLGLDAVARPVLTGGVKEILRYAPLELTRLGVGAISAPEDNFGDLLADVGLSTLLAGGFGGIGGFFRAGGVDAPATGKVLGADVALKPAFEFRLGRVPGAQSSTAEPLDEVMLRLRDEVFTEVPHHKALGGLGKYVNELEGSTPESVTALNSLFRAQGASKQSPGLSKQILLEGAETDARTLNPGQQQELLGALGFTNIDELAELTVYPRVVQVKSTRGAGSMSQILDQPAGLAQVADGTYLGKEANSGLWVVAKRIESGNASGKRKLFGEAKVSAGDRWFITKTDKPQMFAPGVHETAERTVAYWSKLKEPFQPGSGLDVFSQSMDQVEAAVSAVDYTNLAKMGKKGFISKVAENIGRKAMNEAGLSGSTSARMMGEWIWDVAAPTVFKERGNALYGRLLMQLNSAMRVADTEVFKMVRGKAVFEEKTPLKSIMTSHTLTDEWENGLTTLRKQWSSLTDAERDLVVMAAKTQTPADDLARLAADGSISAEAVTAVKNLQAIDKHFMDQKFLPALATAGRLDDFKPLEGYLLPRLFKGDWHAEIVDEAGRRQWLAVGSLAGAKKEAQAVIDEAAARGVTWKLKGDVQHAVAVGPNELEALSDFVSKSFSHNPDSADIVRDAMRKLMIARGNKKPGMLTGTPGSFKERGGAAGSPDLERMTTDEILGSLETHYKQLMRFGAYHVWKQRYMPVALKMQSSNPTLFADLQRKAHQFMGIEGQLTKVQNQILQPVLGPLLGNKAATKIAQATNATMYQWNLAILNPTFALLNLLTPLQTVAPWVKMMTSVSEEQAAKYMMMVPTVDQLGRPRGQAGVLHPMKVLKQAMGSLRNPADDLKQFQQQALTDGTLLPQHYDAFAGAQSEGARTLADAWKEGGMVDFLKKGSNWMADKSEQLSRMTAFNAAYHLGKDFFRLEGDQLYRFTQQGVRATMYGYSVIDRSRMFTGPIGSMFGLFKNWQMHFMGNMMEYAGLARQGNFGPLMWQGGAALALGGLGATPLKAMADGLANYASDTPDSYLWLQENWQDSADEIYFGLPAFLGASLQASSTIPGTDVRNEASNLMNFVIWERAKAAGKAIGDAWTLADQTGENPLMNDNSRDALIAAFGPRAMFRASSATEGDYIRSMGTGYPSVRGLDPSTKILYSLGLNQVEIDRHQVAGKQLWKQQEAMRTAVSNLGIAYAEAQMEGDTDSMQRVIDQTLMSGIPLSSVMKSAQTRVRRETTGDSLSRYDKELAGRYVQALDR